MRRYWTALLFAVVALMASACELRIATEIIVARDHSGEVVVSVVLDEETGQDLVDAGLIPTAGLEEAAAAASDWSVEVIENTGTGIRLRHEFTDPAEVGALLSALSSDLGVEDGELWDGLRLTSDGSGGLLLQGRAGVVAPSVAGAEGAGVAFDGEDLAALLERDGRTAVRHDLQVVAATGHGANDADREADGALVWELPTGELRPIHAVLLAPDRIPWEVYGIAAVGAMALTFLVTWLVRRRRG